VAAYFFYKKSIQYPRIKKQINWVW